jgi:hypothetical protein
MKIDNIREFKNSFQPPYKGTLPRPAASAPTSSLEIGQHSKRTFRFVQKSDLEPGNKQTGC